MKLEDNLRSIVYQFQNDICYLHQMNILALADNDKEYYRKLMNVRTEDLMKQIVELSNLVQKEELEVGQKEFTLEELSAYNGSGGETCVRSGEWNRI